MSVESVKSSQPLQVFQKQCVISNSKNIVVGSFGPCYVLTGYDKETKYIFLAHIDDMTQVDSISHIFKALNKLNIPPARLKLSLMGGWKENAESAKWGAKIIEHLKQYKVASLDTSLYQKKTPRSPMNQTDKLDEIAQNYFFGGLLNVQTGEFKFFKKPWEKLEEAQMAAKEEAMAKLLKTVDPEGKVSPSSPTAHAIISQLAMAEEEQPLSVVVS